MKSFDTKDSFLKKREAALKKKLEKEKKKNVNKKRKKCLSYQISGLNVLQKKA